MKGLHVDKKDRCDIEGQKLGKHQPPRPWPDQETAAGFGPGPEFEWRLPETKNFLKSPNPMALLNLFYIFNQL